MKHKTLKSSYEAPTVEVQNVLVEGILCYSFATGQNEPFDDLENDYEFDFTK